MRTVCVVEDDPAIRRGLVDSLRFAGFAVVEHEDGRAARETLLSAELDLVLLDVVLPGLDGIEFLPELRRARPRLPVILVTARGAEEDRVRGLKNGADDYVVKPFSSTELLARVEAVLRRSAERPQDVARLCMPGLTGEVQVWLERREVRHPDGTTRQLTEREAELLSYLARSAGRAVARDEILRHVWGLDPTGIDTRTVDMTIARVREKLVGGEAGSESQAIVTVRGRG